LRGSERWTNFCPHCQKKSGEGVPDLVRETMKVLIYVDTSKEVGDRDHLKVFANELAANRWFEDNDPLGVAFEYEVQE
jgi:hypothetical protein